MSRKSEISTSESQQATAPKTSTVTTQQSSEEKREGKKKYRLLEMCGIVASILGVGLGTPSFYPRLTVTDPDPSNHHGLHATHGLNTRLSSTAACCELLG